MALPQRLRFRHGRPVYVGLALISYLLAASGIPVPAASARPRHGLFPCQGHACGCSCAEECWAHCCCFSAPERARWAQAHGLGIPPALQEALAAEAHSGCAHGCCHAPTHDADDTRCETSARTGWQVLIRALHCRGVTTLWISTGAVLPPPPPVAWSPCWDASQLLTQASHSVPFFLAEPPLHPPRAGA